MAITVSERRRAIAAQAEQELRGLEARGVRMTGNAFSPMLLVKGELNEAELAGGELLSGADGEALRAALSRMGWQPEDFCALATVAGPGDGTSSPVAPGEPLPVALFREAVEALDPEAVILLDGTAAAIMRETYADMLVIIEDFDEAMLAPGKIVRVSGRRVLALEGFEASLADPVAKREAWHHLQMLRPLDEPL